MRSLESRLRSRRRRSKARKTRFLKVIYFNVNWTASSLSGHLADADDPRLINEVSDLFQSFFFSYLKGEFNCQGQMQHFNWRKPQNGWTSTTHLMVSVGFSYKYQLRWLLLRNKRTLNTSFSSSSLPVASCCRLLLSMVILRGYYFIIIGKEDQRVLLLERQSDGPSRWPSRGPKNESVDWWLHLGWPAAVMLIVITLDKII